MLILYIYIYTVEFYAHKGLSIFLLKGANTISLKMLLEKLIVVLCCLLFFLSIKNESNGDDYVVVKYGNKTF